MNSSSLYKRKKAILFWRTEGDPPHCPPTPLQFFAGMAWSASEDTGLCSSGLGSSHFYSTKYLTSLQGSSYYVTARTWQIFNKCLLNWAIIFCLNWARVLLMDTPALSITFTQWYSIHPPLHWAMSGDMLGYQNTGGGAVYITGISWVESSDAANHLAVHRKP